MRAGGDGLFVGREGAAVFPVLVVQVGQVDLERVPHEGGQLGPGALQDAAEDQDGVPHPPPLGQQHAPGELDPGLQAGDGKAPQDPPSAVDVLLRLVQAAFGDVALGAEGEKFRGQPFVPFPGRGFPQLAPDVQGGGDFPLEVEDAPPFLTAVHDPHVGGDFGLAGRRGQPLPPLQVPAGQGEVGVLPGRGQAPQGQEEIVALPGGKLLAERAHPEKMAGFFPGQGQERGAGLGEGFPRGQPVQADQSGEEIVAGGRHATRLGGDPCRTGGGFGPLRPRQQPVFQGTAFPGDQRGQFPGRGEVGLAGVWVRLAGRADGGSSPPPRQAGQQQGGSRPESPHGVSRPPIRTGPLRRNRPGWNGRPLAAAPDR